jgi:hypothetical protein
MSWLSFLRSHKPASIPLFSFRLVQKEDRDSKKNALSGAPFLSFPFSKQGSSPPPVFFVLGLGLGSTSLRDISFHISLSGFLCEQQQTKISFLFLSMKNSNKV